MKVMVIVKASKASEAGEMPSEQLLREMGDYNEQLAKAGIMLAGEGLHPSSKGARVAFDGRNRTVIDGPFAETKELIAGYWIWQVKSLEEAVDWLKRCPNPHDEKCEVEIRPIFSADDFGAALTPELREQEASIRAQSLGLGAVRFENQPERKLAGLRQRYTKEMCEQIPAQWDRFAAALGKKPGELGQVSYGVSSNQGPDCSFDYLTAVEVGNETKPAELMTSTLPARRYAIFTLQGGIKSLPPTLEKIWTQWKPDSGLKVAQAPCLERYPADFDPERAGCGEIWIPLEA